MFQWITSKFINNVFEVPKVLNKIIDQNKGAFNLFRFLSIWHSALEPIKAPAIWGGRVTWRIPTEPIFRYLAVFLFRSRETGMLCPDEAKRRRERAFCRLLAFVALRESKSWRGSWWAKKAWYKFYCVLVRSRYESESGCRVSFLSR